MCGQPLTPTDTGYQVPVGDNTWGMETLEGWVAIDKEKRRLKAEAEERENAAATARNQKREIMMNTEMRERTGERGYGATTHDPRGPTTHGPPPTTHHPPPTTHGPPPTTHDPPPTTHHPPPTRGSPRPSEAGTIARAQ